MKTNLRLLVEKLESRIPDNTMKKERISRVTVGWHIEHSLLIIIKTTNELCQSDPALYSGNFNFTRFMVFILNKIPRGIGKSPKVVTPSGDITRETLEKSLSLAKEKIKELETIPQDRFFKHPYFGHIQLKDTLKFLEIHTRHHLKIMEDIVK